MLSLLATFALAVQGTPQLPPVGLALGAKANPKEEDFLASVRELIRMNITGIAASVSWKDLDPGEGSTELKPINDSIGISKLVGAKNVLTIKTIDTNNKVVPDDLLQEAWNSPKMKARLTTTLRSILPTMTNQVSALSLGNEVDVYLAAHPDEVGPFLELVDHVREQVKRSAPDLPVGLTSTHEGLLKRGPLSKRIHEDTDVIFMTYYCVNDTFGPRPIGDVPKDFARMVQFAGPKPLVMQEIGMPAATEVGGSEELQAEFVKASLAELKKHKAKITLASFFSQYDFSPDMLNFFQSYYGISDPKFRAFLGSLGMRKSDGTARKALATLKQALAEN